MSQRLHVIHDPASIAVIGASSDPLKFGGRVIHCVVKHRRIVPINASTKEVLGLPAFPSIAAAPGPIDVADRAVPTPAIAPALDECGRAGVKCVVVIASDYAEAGDEGRARQEELVAIVDKGCEALRGRGCPFVNRMDDAIGVIRAALAYRAGSPSAEQAQRPSGFGDVVQAAQRLPAKDLTEHEAKSLLALAGVPVTREIEVAQASEAPAAAAALRFPVAVKAVSRRLSHKGDAGTVKLRLHDERAVQQDRQSCRAHPAQGSHGNDARLRTARRPTRISGGAS
jgi:acyl-CoA synthetase (NDP forming)